MTRKTNTARKINGANGRPSYMVEVRDAAGEWNQIGREPFPAATADEAIAIYREQSGDTETPDERIRALPPLEV